MEKLKTKVRIIMRSGENVEKKHILKKMYCGENVEKKHTF